MRRLWLAALVLAMIDIVATAWATNQTVSVTAKSQDNPQQTPADIEGHFTQAPNADKDEIHVTNNNVKAEGAGVYNDPVNDGALLTIAQQENPVKVNVEGREGIGAMYYVTVKPTGGGGGGGPTILWADVEDMNQPGALGLKDTNTAKGTSDSTDSDNSTPNLLCKTASDGKGDVEFWLNTDSGTYDWAIIRGGSAIASGTLISTSSPPYDVTQSDIPAGVHSLVVTKQGDQNFRRRIDFVIAIVEMKVKRQGSADAPAGSAIIAAGIESSPVHMADITVTAKDSLNQPIAGLTYYLNIADTDATGVDTDAVLSASSGVTDATGSFTKTYTSGDKKRDGNVVDLRASDSLNDDVLASVTIDQKWDDANGADFLVPGTFLPEVSDTCDFRCNLATGTPIGGHLIVYYTWAANIYSFEWNLDTGAMSGGTSQNYEEPFDQLPFGLAITALIAHTDAVEVEGSPGVYRNTQTVHDYFDIVEVNGQMVWREAYVNSYDFAVYDPGVFAD